MQHLLTKMHPIRQVRVHEGSQNETHDIKKSFFKILVNVHKY